MYVVKDLVPVSWKFVDNILLTQVCFPMVPCYKAARASVFSGSFTHETRDKKRKTDALLGYSTACTFQVPVKETP